MKLFTPVEIDFNSNDFFENKRKNEFNVLQDFIYKLQTDNLSGIDKDSLIAYLNSQQVIVAEKVKAYREKKNVEESIQIDELSDEDLEYGLI